MVIGGLNMKRTVGFLLVLLVFSTLGCEGLPQATEYFFGDYRVYYQSHGLCEMWVMQPLTEDEGHRYYLTSSGCSAGDYYYIRIGFQFVSVAKAIENGWITIADLTDSQAPFVTIETKEMTPS